MSEVQAITLKGIAISFQIMVRLDLRILGRSHKNVTLMTRHHEFDELFHLQD